MKSLRIITFITLAMQQAHVSAAGSEEAYRELDQRYREQHERMEAAYSRLEHELSGEERYKPGASAQLKEARLAWQNYSNKLCVVMSRVYGGGRGFFEMECKIRQEESFEKTLKSFGW